MSTRGHLLLPPRSSENQHWRKGHHNDGRCVEHPPGIGPSRVGRTRTVELREPKEHRGCAGCHDTATTAAAAGGS